MPNRFVIHTHSGYGKTHWDLMLACGDALATWQLSQTPEQLAPGESMAVLKIQDHRTAYLDYEGTVSRGRGKVDMLDGGKYQLLAKNQTRWEIRLEGREIRGLFAIELTGPGPNQWKLTRLEKG